MGGSETSHIHSKYNHNNQKLKAHEMPHFIVSNIEMNVKKISKFFFWKDKSVMKFLQILVT